MKRAGNVAVAVGLGYALGRQHKLSLALLLAAAAATGHLGKGPLGKMLVGGGGGSDGAQPQESADGGGPGALGQLSGVGKSALSKTWEVLAERLNERAESLRQNGQSRSESEQS